MMQTTVMSRPAPAASNVISLRERFNSVAERSDLLVFSHQRWEPELHRTHELMCRFAKERRVYFIEEPIVGVVPSSQLYFKDLSCGVLVVIPYLPAGMTTEEQNREMKGLICDLFEDESIRNYTLWFDSPSSWPFARHLKPIAVIYDCPQEIAVCQQRDPDFLMKEAELLRQADLVFHGAAHSHQSWDQQWSLLALQESEIYRNREQARVVGRPDLDQVHFDL